MTLPGCTVGSAHAVLPSSRVARMQVVSAVKRQMSRTSDKPDSRLALCYACPADFRVNLQEHVDAMAPFGFNAHALGLLAKRNMLLLLDPPDKLAAHFAMLRGFFRPWGDELAGDISQTRITSVCLPAVAHDAVHAPDPSATTARHESISQLHKAVLAGPRWLMHITRQGLEERMRTLVAAGLCATEAAARRESMQRTTLLNGRSLPWYLERRAAVLEVGGDEDDVRAAFRQNHSLRVTLARLLLYRRARCAASLMATRPGRRALHRQWSILSVASLCQVMQS